MTMKQLDAPHHKRQRKMLGVMRRDKIEQMQNMTIRHFEATFWWLLEGDIFTG